MTLPLGERLRAGRIYFLVASVSGAMISENVIRFGLNGSDTR